MRQAASIVAATVSLVLAGCGGGSGGGGGGGDGTLEKPAGDFVAFLADGTESTRVELFVSDADGDDVRAVSGALDADDGNVAAFAWSPNRARIAFLQDKDGDDHAELYVVDPATGVPAPIFDAGPALGSEIFDFLWSPTSTHLAVRWRTGLTTTQLSVYSADGSQGTTVSGTIVPPGDVLAGYAWRPDGSRIAFRGDLLVDEKFDLFTNVVDGSDRRLIDDFAFNAAADVFEGFAWSFDGSRIAFLADLTVAAQIDLYTNDADGGDEVLESDPVATGDVQSFAWSPVANVLAYEHDAANDDVYDLLVVTSPDGTPANRTSYPALGNADVQSYAWSPNGARIAVLDDDTIDLVTLLPFAGGPALVDVTVERFAWSPDSTRLAYAQYDVQGANLVQNLVVSPATGGAPVPLSTFTADGSGIFEFQWAPDGAWVGFTAFPTSSPAVDLFVAAANGSSTQMLYDGTSLFDGASLVGFGPTSETICYTGMPANTTAIFTVLVDGTDEDDLSLPLLDTADCFAPAIK
jgi:Tol biopolymer transport system component